MLEKVVNGNHDGHHLSSFAVSAFAASLGSKRQAKIAAARGELLVDGAPATHGLRVHEGQRVTLTTAAPSAAAAAALSAGCGGGDTCCMRTVAAAQDGAKLESFAWAAFGSPAVGGAAVPPPISSRKQMRRALQSGCVELLGAAADDAARTTGHRGGKSSSAALPKHVRSGQRLVLRLAALRAHEASRKQGQVTIFEPGGCNATAAPRGMQSSSSSSSNADKVIGIAWQDEHLAIVWKPAGMKIKGCGGAVGAARPGGMTVAEASELERSGAGTFEQGLRAAMAPGGGAAGRNEAMFPCLVQGGGRWERSSRWWGVPKAAAGLFLVAKNECCRSALLAMLAPPGCSTTADAAAAAAAAATAAGIGHTPEAVVGSVAAGHVQELVGGGLAVRRCFLVMVHGRVVCGATATSAAGEEERFNAAAAAAAAVTAVAATASDGFIGGLRARVTARTGSNRFGDLTTLHIWPAGEWFESGDEATPTPPNKRCRVEIETTVAPANMGAGDSDGALDICAVLARAGHPVVGDPARAAQGQARAKGGVMLALTSIQLLQHPIAAAAAASEQSSIIARWPEPPKFGVLRAREANYFGQRCARDEEALALAREAGQVLADDESSSSAPVEYRVGRARFCGLTFRVSPAVMIPRAATETLVEVAVRLLQRRAELKKIPHAAAAAAAAADGDGDDVAHVVDLGTGSGAILLSVLQRCRCSTSDGGDGMAVGTLPAADGASAILGDTVVRGTGVDISEDALSVARANCAALGLGNVARFVHGDFGSLRVTASSDGSENVIGAEQSEASKFTLLPHAATVVLCNPPYADATVELKAAAAGSSASSGLAAGSASAVRSARLDQRVRTHEPALAMLAGEGGFAAYRSVARSLACARGLLVPGGWVVFEVGNRMAARVIRIMQECAGLEWVETVRDQKGMERCLVFRRLREAE
jgi:release factor glutamine methyltransferase